MDLKIATPITLKTISTHIRKVFVLKQIVLSAPYKGNQTTIIQYNSEQFCVYIIYEVSKVNLWCGNYIVPAYTPVRAPVTQAGPVHSLPSIFRFISRSSSPSNFLFFCDDLHLFSRNFVYCTVSFLLSCLS